MFIKKTSFFIGLLFIITSCEINLKKQDELIEDDLVFHRTFDKDQTIIKVGGEYVKNRNNELNKALKLNGNNEFVLFKNSKEINISKEISISIWFKPKEFIGEGNNSIISKGNIKHKYPFYQYHIGVVGSKDSLNYKQFTFSLSVSNKTHTIKTDNNFWEAGKWYNLIGTYNNQEINFYVDGKLIPSSIYVSGNIDEYDTPLCIGNFSNNINFFTPGVFDDLKIYNKSISLKKIKEIYASNH